MSADAPVDDVAAQVAARTLARRGTDYVDEVRRLLDAALTVMSREGPTGRARVADIVAEAGLSNDAFYRHFPSKDALVAALLEDGTRRLAQYLTHQMGKETDPERKVRRWVEGMLSQTSEKTAATTLAVLFNGGSVGPTNAEGRHDATAPLSVLLHEPFRALGCTSPELPAQLVAHALLGRVADHLWARTRPRRDETDRITTFCINAARQEAK
jgi:AcrR family transcriptional regulator